MSAQNRRSKLGLVDPDHQLRFAFYLIGGGITALMLFCLYKLVALESRITAIMSAANVPTDVSDELIDQVGRAEIHVAVVSLVLMLISVFMGVKLSNRIYGPIVQFRKHVNALINGDTKTRVHLRDGDHFFHLGDDLNALAEKLDKK